MSKLLNNVHRKPFKRSTKLMQFCQVYLKAEVNEVRMFILIMNSVEEISRLEIKYS